LLCFDAEAVAPVARTRSATKPTSRDFNMKFPSCHDASELKHQAATSE
jgi:hypothetical protein